MLDGEIYIDLTKRDSSVFDNIKVGDFIVFLAAISSPDMCDKSYNFAYEINVVGTKWFISEAIKKGANILFFSSDVVNGATDKPADENFVPNPFGKYAKMKCEIEEYFSKEKQVKFFRLSYVFSKEDKFMKYLMSCVSENKEAEVFEALYRNVIYIDDVIDGILNLSKTFETYENNSFNMSGSQLLSRLDLANIYKECINPNLKISVIKPPIGFFDARPNCIETKSRYVAKLLNHPPTLIKEAMIKEFYDERKL